MGSISEHDTRYVPSSQILLERAVSASVVALSTRQPVPLPAGPTLQELLFGVVGCHLRGAFVTALPVAAGSYLLDDRFE